MGVSEAYEDAANCLWLLTNSKPCANCKSPIQKNEGCNHMQCAKVSERGLHLLCSQSRNLIVSPKDKYCKHKNLVFQSDSRRLYSTFFVN